MADTGCCCLQCVSQQTVGVVEDLGQFKALKDPGFHFIMWPCSSIVSRLSLRIQQLDVVCETKTKDNVFVKVSVAVQYRVIQESAYDAYYRLTDPRGQIQSHVFDVVRSEVPRQELDQAFASKDDIAAAVMAQLRNVMKDYGYEIIQSLVTGLDPDAKVKASMNEINASRRLKEAASHKAEADKVKQVKSAEAEAEARYLSGLGVARQRKAIVQGLQSSVSEFSEDVKGASPKDVMDIVLLSQYFDTLTAVGANNIIIEYDPQTVANLQGQVGKSFMRDA
uniref:Band 7 domain-containing protein n=1 Tax=Helicotheca tamesis TaxID=374047 RepID=A0A7S2HMG7_9STRA|mmetsp:Transcript_19467/g.26730  ORF Transcript_19467/g.26730 Transcript_19467/m.26730 type:complete len:280 (+) Transcript_19467:153-992(+)|eukprot:CAMPEP_0185728908 /NCGR_PEP_ID=MMETSP1171-20130828/4320_1 /TAXON_ID=374046 /ORGANISM="Helicotheca tamensis, Strain CCMP826" /LENGTH=279 /DNA_ID=CAMNT_0028397661 /DNA_START=92 /DNA_END=931 /DNA_ORIENTATION=+